MPFEVLCPACRTKIKASEKYAARVVRCPACEFKFRLPSLEKIQAARAKHAAAKRDQQRIAARLAEKPDPPPGEADAGKRSATERQPASSAGSKGGGRPKWKTEDAASSAKPAPPKKQRPPAEPMPPPVAADQTAAARPSEPKPTVPKKLQAKKPEPKTAQPKSTQPKSAQPKKPEAPRRPTARPTQAKSASRRPPEKVPARSSETAAEKKTPEPEGAVRREPPRADSAPPSRKTTNKTTKKPTEKQVEKAEKEKQTAETGSKAARVETPPPLPPKKQPDQDRRQKTDTESKSADKPKIEKPSEPPPLPTPRSPEKGRSEPPELPVDRRQQSPPQDAARGTASVEAAAPVDAGPEVYGNEADPGHRRTTRQLAFSLAALALVGLIPVVIGYFEHLQVSRDRPLDRWIFLLLFISFVQLAYVLFIWQVPDFGTLLIGVFATAIPATFYAVIMGLSLLARADNELISALGLLEERGAGRATGWCLIMVSLSATLAYFFYRSSHRWRRALHLLVGSQRRAAA